MMNTSDILYLAASYLSHNRTDKKPRWVCAAVALACQHAQHGTDKIGPRFIYNFGNNIEVVLHSEGLMAYRAVWDFFNDLDFDGENLPFDDVEDGQPRQAVRFAWLMFAADLAKEWRLK